MLPGELDVPPKLTKPDSVCARDCRYRRRCCLVAVIPTLIDANAPVTFHRKQPTVPLFRKSFRASISAVALHKKERAMFKHSLMATVAAFASVLVLIAATPSSARAA